MNRPPLWAVAAFSIGTMFSSGLQAEQVASQTPTMLTTKNFSINYGISSEFTNGEYGKGTGASLSGTAYVEGVYNGFYAGVLAISTDQHFDNEIDLYFGLRKELESGLSYDLSYRRYNYPNAGGDAYGELGASVFVPVNDKFGTTYTVAFDPESKVGNAYFNGAFYATEALSISVDYGVYEVVDSETQAEWSFGGTYSLNDTSSVDLRWYEGTEYDGYVALAVSFDTSVLSN